MSAKTRNYDRNTFFSLIVFAGTQGPIVNILLCRRSEDSRAYKEVPSQMAAHLRTGSPLQAGEMAGFEPTTAVLQYGVATNEPPLLIYTTWTKGSIHRRQVQDPQSPTLSKMTILS